MALIETVSPKDAQGPIAAVYQRFLDGTGMIPGPLRLMSASPGLFELYTQGFAYWPGHATLSPPLLASIRYLVACEECFEACDTFNAHMLQAQGMTSEELVQLRDDPRTAPLEDKETELLAFVIESLKDPKSATREKIDALIQLGWTETDIYDATYHGAVLVFLGRLMEIFGPVPTE